MKLLLPAAWSFPDTEDRVHAIVFSFDVFFVVHMERNVDRQNQGDESLTRSQQFLGCLSES